MARSHHRGSSCGGGNARGPSPQSHRLQGWWVLVPEPPGPPASAVGRFPAGPGWGSVPWGAAPGYLPSEGPGAIKICSKQSLPFPGTFQKEQKTPTIIKEKKKLSFPSAAAFPCLVFSCPHTSSLRRDRPQLGVCTAPGSSLGLGGIYPAVSSYGSSRAQTCGTGRAKPRWVTLAL